MANDIQSLKTASKKVRYLGSAKSGVFDARMTHITSLALLPLGIAFVWIVLSLIGRDYASVYRELGHPLPTIVMILFVAASVYHMQLGTKTIINDYVHARHAKDLVLMANIFFCAIIGVACIYSLLKVSFT